jgi:HEAT repeat protein
MIVETRQAKDEVGRAVAAARRAIGRMVALMGDEDPAVVRAASQALAELSAAAVVGPLAEALPRASSPRHRVAIIGALLTFGPEARAAVNRALVAALKRERNPHVRAAAQMAFGRLIMSEMAQTVDPRGVQGRRAERFGNLSLSTRLR